MYRNKASTAAAAFAASSLSLKVNSSSIHLQYLSPSHKTLTLFRNLSTHAPQRSDFYNKTLGNSPQNSYSDPYLVHANTIADRGYSQNPVNGYSLNPINHGNAFSSQQFQQNTNVGAYRGNIPYREPSFPTNEYLTNPNGSYDANTGGGLKSAQVGYSVGQRIPIAWNQQMYAGIQGNQSWDSAGKAVNAKGYQVVPDPNVGNIGFRYNPNGMPVGSGDSFALTNGNPNNGSPPHSPYKGSFEDLDAFCRENKVKEAVQMLEVLVKEGITVDLPRYVLLMQLCAKIGVPQYAKSVHNHLVKSILPIDLAVHNKILDMYANCGSMSYAYRIFQNMTERNFTSWDTMITGLAKNGHGDDAIQLFTQFKATGMKPDGQMFMGVFLACSVVSDVNEGMLHFESMSKVYGIVPSMEHYVSVMSMLGSAGYLEEAKEFIEKMPIEPNTDVWETLMNICRCHGNTELGDYCEDIVSYLDPSRSVDKSKKGLVPMKNSDIEKEVEKKKLSNNFMDVRSKVYEYKAGDTKLPENQKYYVLLRGMMAQMKEIGYVPNLRCALHDVDDEIKGEHLLSHSERIALAQCLMETPVRREFQIRKNLRACCDCHTTLKFASKITGRKISVRDAKRWHHFKNGNCSCNDFW